MYYLPLLFLALVKIPILALLVTCSLVTGCYKSVTRNESLWKKCFCLAIDAIHSVKLFDTLVVKRAENEVDDLLHKEAHWFHGAVMASCLLTEWMGNNETCPRIKKKRTNAVLKVIIAHFQSYPVYMLSWAFSKIELNKSTKHRWHMNTIT